MSYSPKIEWELSIKQSPPTQDISDKQKRKDRNHGQKFLHIVAHQTGQHKHKNKDTTQASKASPSPQDYHSESPLVSYPARCSISFVLGPLHWSSIFPTTREHKNIVQLCTTIPPPAVESPDECWYQSHLTQQRRHQRYDLWPLETPGKNNIFTTAGALVVITV